MLSRSARRSSDIMTVSLNFDSQNDDRNYFNAVIHNSTTADDRQAHYQKTFNQPILENPEEFYLAVNQFSIPLGNIPVYIVPLNPFDSSLSLFEIRVNSVLFPSFRIPVPFTPYTVGITPSDEGYNYIYDYDHFLRDLNRAIVNAILNIPVSILGIGNPIFMFNAATGLFSVIAPSVFADGVTISIDLLGMGDIFEGIPALRLKRDLSGSDPTPSNSIRLEFYPQGNNISTPGLWSPSDLIAYTMTQNYPTLSKWSPIESIRIVTNMMPIEKEYVDSIGGSELVSSSGILLDYKALLNNNEPATDLLHFVQSGPYSLINMNSGAPLYSIEYSFLWVDTDGREHPIILPARTVANARFVFIKKATFTS